MCLHVNVCVCFINLKHNEMFFFLMPVLFAEMKYENEMLKNIAISGIFYCFNTQAHTHIYTLPHSHNSIVLNKIFMSDCMNVVIVWYMSSSVGRSARLSVR